jgi:ribosome-associated protein
MRLLNAINVASRARLHFHFGLAGVSKKTLVLKRSASMMIVKSSRFIGVIKEGDKKTWEAVLDLSPRRGEDNILPRTISGGEYETEEEAAKAYDALVRMYLGGAEGSDVKTNFPIDDLRSWIPPESVIATGQIEVKIGVPLTVDEITAALQLERGIDVKAVNLKGKSDLAEALVFVTGRSVTHMRRMADMVCMSLRKRRLPGAEDPSVEAREMDDWMLVDCGNIIVSVMDVEARSAFNLEQYWENMRLGVDPYQGKDFDSWLEENPVPKAWTARLEKDEAELTLQKRGRRNHWRGGQTISKPKQ